MAVEKSVQFLGERAPALVEVPLATVRGLCLLHPLLPCDLGMPCGTESITTLKAAVEALGSSYSLNLSKE